jgi:aspartate aminotransferase-like enzyme
MKPLAKRRIFSPGPTPLLPQAVLEPLLVPMHHRKEDFKQVFREVQKGLRELLGTENDIILLSSSGSGAMEAAITNLLAPGEKALVAVAGKFGERWTELARAYDVRAEVLEFPYGESIDPQAVDRALARDSQIVAVFMQATETSTGARMDVEAIARAVRSRGEAVLVVDAITGLGTMPLETDAWGLDIVIGGSQKAFMVPPGVAILSVSARAWSRIESCVRPRYYFDLRRERDGQREGLASVTPSISVVQGLRVALETMLQGGRGACIENARLQAGALRAACASWGLKLLPRNPADAITAMVLPDGVDPARVIAILRDRFGAHVEGGQGSLKGKIVRVGHLGYFDFLETLGLVGCLELALAEAGAHVEIGAGTRAALEHYRCSVMGKAR